MGKEREDKNGKNRKGDKNRKTGKEIKGEKWETEKEIKMGKRKTREKK